MIVEDIGFHLLLSTLEPLYEIHSRHNITDAILPKVYDGVIQHVSALVHGVLAFSFTTDIWTSSVCPMSLLSLTAQWTDDEFTPHQVILHGKPVRCSHTSQAIVGAFDSMLQTWGIPKKAVHIVFRDNAKNMIKAMSDAELPILPCTTHTFQLKVHKGLLSQRSVADAVATGLKIVGHLNIQH